ncbi:MAG: M48 family metallopeptidase [Oscillospiraceae bacterium]
MLHPSDNHAEKPIAYEIIRSNRRSLSLEISQDVKILVRAPWQCSRAEINRFVLKHRDWLSTHLEIQRRRLAAFPEPTDSERLSLIARANAELPQRVAYFSAVMGLVPSGITITGAKTRFGSCSAKNRLCFSWRLMRYPEAAIDYVVVHELAHIAHKNHGQAFYAMIADILPNYKDRIKLLKR